MAHPTPSPSAPDTTAARQPPPSPANRDSRRGWCMAVATALIVLGAVLFFNFAGPRQPTVSPGEGHSTPASQGANQTGGPAANGAVESAAPQRSDTPTPAGREGVGAPAGAAPQAPAAAGAASR